MGTPFEMQIVVTDGDIDELGHLNNVRYVQWVQDVAVAHSASVGLDYPTYVAIGGVFVLRRHEADYLRSVPPGAKVLARTWIGAMRAAQVERHMEFLLDGEVVFTSLTRWVFVDTRSGRPARIPARVLEAFASSIVQRDAGRA